MAQSDTPDRMTCEVGKLPTERAIEFREYLASRGIRAEIYELQDGISTIVTGSAESMRAAKAELLAFTQAEHIQKIPPFIPSSAESQENGQSRANFSLSQRSLPGSSLLGRFRRGGLTTLVEVLCLAAFVALWWDDEFMLFAFGLSERTGFTGITDWYRLLTPAFLHFGLIHIAFNLVMWEAFARHIERILGSVKLAVLFVSIAIVSNWLQYEVMKSSGNFFGGMSGVVYGLIGYLGVLSLRGNVPQALRLPPGLLTVSGLFILCGFFLNGIANFCHLGGLVAGALWGVFDNFRANRKRYGSTL